MPGGPSRLAVAAPPPGYESAPDSPAEGTKIDTTNGVDRDGVVVRLRRSSPADGEPKKRPREKAADGL